MQQPSRPSQPEVAAKRLLQGCAEHIAGDQEFLLPICETSANVLAKTHLLVPPGDGWWPRRGRLIVESKLSDEPRKRQARISLDRDRRMGPRARTPYRPST